MTEEKKGVPLRIWHEQDLSQAKRTLHENRVDEFYKLLQSSKHPTGSVFGELKVKLKGSEDFFATRRDEEIRERTENVHVQDWLKEVERSFRLKINDPVFLMKILEEDKDSKKCIAIHLISKKMTIADFSFYYYFGSGPAGEDEIRKRMYNSSRQDRDEILQVVQSS